MTARIVWKGLAVVDGEGRVVTWRGSETPKLFHSDEQAQHHRVDGCTLQPVLLIHGSHATAPEYTRHTADQDAPAPATAPRAPMPAALSSRAFATQTGQRPIVIHTAPSARAIPTAEPKGTKARRRYKPKACKGCHQSFAPSGPRSLYCGRCP